MAFLRDRFTEVAVFRVKEQLFIQAGAEERTILLLANGDPHPEGTAPASGPSVPSQTLTTSKVGLSTGDDMRSRPEQGPPSASEACGVLDRLVRADRLASLGSIMNVSIGEVIGAYGHPSGLPDNGRNSASPSGTCGH